MPRIAVLPSAVADQIAAGEVVERPASVVKELVENALDAGATSVEIEVQDGGREGIRVSDDGSGMERDDAVLALERHATSKIRRAEDLVGVGSFGFRGEALPAICSVSRLEIETAPADGEGTRVEATAGAVVSVDSVARRRGTTIRVTRLFHNAPARRKFLKGTRSEWRSVSEMLITLALTRRDVRFSIANDGRHGMVFPPAPTLRDRVAAIFGGSMAASLMEVEDISGTMHVSGLVERPADVGTSARRVHLTINGRAIRDTGIVRAAEAAYRSTIPAGVRPTLFLEIVLSGADVDVNVHPAKAEVRFRDRWAVERVVETAVRRALGTMEAAAPIGALSWPRAASPEPRVVGVEALRPTEYEAPGFLAHREPDVAVADEPAQASNLPAADGPATPEQGLPQLIQLKRTYIMFEHENGVVLIDQHSAHERVLFERFMNTLERGGAPSQRLLFPLTLHLSGAEAEAFETYRETFVRLGFEIEGFGGNTLIVAAVPMPHPRFDAEQCLRDTLAALAGDRSASAATRHEHLAATVACKAAIKAGQDLSPGEMRALFVALRDTTLPAHDVHGRSTIVQVSWDELERRFGRR
ncbi:MAG TPA: DNA mismatch repair endonuclease MutL [Gemmatimonadaceae bacterium]|nr:DNA mismatch repair endonuclease MutL [Gemmatimonadaceae bacterium]